MVLNLTTIFLGLLCNVKILHASEELNLHMRSHHDISVFDYYRSHVEEKKPAVAENATDKTIRRLQVLIKKLQNDQTSPAKPAAPAKPANTKLAGKSDTSVAAAGKSHPSAKWVNR